jgi:hypothetical protein
MNFLRLGTPLELFSKFYGPLCETMDCGTISKKLRGPFAKFPKITNF